MPDTLDQIAYNILNKMEGGRAHHNTYYSLDQIKYNIENYRTLFLRRDLRESHDLRNFEQKINMNMFRITESKVNGNISYALESIKEIPMLLRLKHQMPLMIKNEQSKVTIPVIDHHGSYYQQNFNRYTNRNPRAFMRGNLLYITGDPVSKQLEGLINNKEELDTEKITANVTDIEIYGLFEKPTEVMQFNGIDLDDVGNQPYPITKDFIQRITEGLINGELQMLMQTPSDTKHNATPDHQLGLLRQDR